LFLTGLFLTGATRPAMPPSAPVWRNTKRLSPPTEAGARKAPKFLTAHHADSTLSPNTHSLQIMTSGEAIGQPYHQASTRAMRQGHGRWSMTRLLGAVPDLGNGKRRPNVSTPHQPHSRHHMFVVV